jgi:uncharacterized protein DUF5666/BACON domain-containing protein/all-beta uncharacterized protein
MMPAHACGSSEHRYSLAVRCALLFVTVGAAIGCGSTETTSSVGPCAATASTNPSTFPATGGSGELVVSSARECAWSASSPDAWIALVPPTDGRGDGKVRYTVSQNTAANIRRGSLMLGSQSTAITQEAAACRFALDPASFALGSGERTASVAVQVAAGCTWTARATASWIEILEGSQGNGPARLTFRVSTNPAQQPRSGSLEIAGLRVEVRQGAQGTEGLLCNYALQPASADTGPAASDGTVSVQTDVGCGWTAVPDQPWVTVMTPSGTGPADIQYHVAANVTGAPRTGRIAVNGSVFSLQQRGCTYAVQPTAASIPAWGGNGSIDVRTQAPCAWTADTPASWITITSSRTGQGTGSATYDVAPNTRLGTRTDVISIAGRDVTITQNGATSITGGVHSVGGSCPNKRFVVHGQRVRTTSSTDYEGGTCGGIRDGTMIRVKGIIGSDDVLTAIEVDFM